MADNTTNNQVVMGLNLDGSWTFFLFQSSQKFVFKQRPHMLCEALLNTLAKMDLQAVAKQAQ